MHFSSGVQLQGFHDFIYVHLNRVAIDSRLSELRIFKDFFFHRGSHLPKSKKVKCQKCEIQTKKCYKFSMKDSSKTTICVSCFQITVYIFKH